MVVTRSRLHAVRYKQAIDAYITKMGRIEDGPRGLWRRRSPRRDAGLVFS